MPKNLLQRTLPTRVTVGLVDGSVKAGWVRGFSPREGELTLSSPTPDGEGLSLATSEVSYVAFHVETPGEELDDCGTSPRTYFDVHLPGGRSMAVETCLDRLEDPIGFSARPTSRDSLYRCVYFFHHGVNAREDRQPFGELLVRSGYVSAEELRQGLEEQERERSTPIGQILVEQAHVDEEVVVRAAEQQKGERRHGRPMRLGEILVEAGLATREQVEEALSEQARRRGKRLGEVLVEMGVVPERLISETLARKFNLPFVDLDELDVDSRSFALVPLGLVSRYDVLPISCDHKALTIALSDPLALEAVDMLRFSTGLQVKEVVVAPTQLRRYIEPLLAASGLRGEDEVSLILQELDQERPDTHAEQTTGGDISSASESDAGVVKLVNRIILDAVRSGASDIHIEPNGPERETAVRLRIDGQCEAFWKLPATYRSQLAARVKIMANLDISERRKPQDGKIKVIVETTKVELRVATLPTVAGEDVVLRVLASGKPIPLDELGLSSRNLSEVRRLTARPYGLVLAVGPTGSGKTTSLHSLLGTVNTESRKIWTAEDPVEITQEGLRQLQVQPRIGLTFATALRAFLRADPDVIMVGEMRDKETASVAVEASLTGHLVLSTLHTNSAAETVTRLVDIGLDPFMFSDALLGVLAQRLARRLCPSCRRPYEPPPNERQLLDQVYGGDALEQRLGSSAPQLWRAPGCLECKGRGYRGRVAIHELLVSSEGIRQAIQQRAPADEIRRLACAGGMTTLLQDGVEKCLDGLTDLQQVVAVCSG